MYIMYTYMYNYTCIHMHMAPVLRPVMCTGVCLSEGGGQGFPGPADQSSYKGHVCTAAVHCGQETTLLSSCTECVQWTTTASEYLSHIHTLCVCLCVGVFFVGKSNTVNCKQYNYTCTMADISIYNVL